MSVNFQIGYFIIIFLIFLIPVNLYSDETAVIHEKIGTEIDKEEQLKYKLFMSIRNFETATLNKTQDGKYYFLVSYFDDDLRSITTREINITDDELSKIRYQIENTIEKKVVDSTTIMQKKTEIIEVEGFLSAANILNYEDQSAFTEKELFISIEGYQEFIGIGINMLTTFYDPIISINMYANYPRNFFLSPYITSGICFYYAMINFSGGLKLNIHSYLAIRLEVRRWQTLVRGKHFSENFFNIGLNFRLY